MRQFENINILDSLIAVIDWYVFTSISIQFDNLKENMKDVHVFVTDIKEPNELIKS